MTYTDLTPPSGALHKLNECGFCKISSTTPSVSLFTICQALCKPDADCVLQSIQSFFRRLGIPPSIFPRRRASSRFPRITGQDDKKLRGSAEFYGQSGVMMKVSMHSSIPWFLETHKRSIIVRNDNNSSSIKVTLSK